MKAFRIITGIALVFTVTIAVLSLIGITVTGLYPAMPVLLVFTLIPIGSRRYAFRNAHYPGTRYAFLMALNVLAIFVVLWMTLVIVHDRVLGDCC